MKAAHVLATWFGAGLSPVAPGTVGTLATVPVYAALVAAGAPWWGTPLAALVVTAVGVGVAGAVARADGHHDPQRVVIDESAGYLLACSFGPPGLLTGAVAFALFRLLDVTKPGPIRALQRLPGGWGVMMDDVLAGLVSGVLTWGLVTLLGGRLS